MERSKDSQGPEGNESLVDIIWVAERLGVGVRYVRRLVAERRIAFVKLGGYVRFEPPAVQRFIEKRRRPPSS